MKKRSGFGWIEFVSGILMILLGIFTLRKPNSMFTGFAIVYGIIAVITGICDIVFYIKSERYIGLGPSLALVAGILGVMTGIALLSHPGVGTWIVSILFPLWFIAHCISRMTHLNVIRIAAGRFYFFFSLVVNILGLVLGVMMFFEPVFSIVAAATIIGVYLIGSGIESIVLAFSRIGSGW